VRLGVQGTWLLPNTALTCAVNDEPLATGASDTQRYWPIGNELDQSDVKLPDMTRIQAA
jgi:hypothetical protein